MGVGPTSEKDGDLYVVDGTKLWVTGIEANILSSKISTDHTTLPEYVIIIDSHKRISNRVFNVDSLGHKACTRIVIHTVSSTNQPEYLCSIVPNVRVYMSSQREMLEQAVEYRGEKVALKLLDSDREVTYREFNSLVNKMGNALRDRGVREGDRVTITLYNTIEFPVSLYACYKVGAVPVPLNYMFAADNFEYVFDDVSPSVNIYDEEFADSIEKASANSMASPDLICVGESNGEVEKFDDVMASGIDASPPDISNYPSRLALIMYTSGTTGKPKGVAISQETASRRTDEVLIAEPGQISGGSKFIASPWFHLGGLGVVESSLSAGETLVSTMNWEPENVAEVIDEHNLTYIVLVPTLAQRILSLNNLDEYDFSSLTGFMCMGSPLSKNLAKKIQANITENVFNSYGSTETTSDLRLTPQDLPENAGKLGKPMHHTQVRLIKHDPGQEFDPHDTVDVGEVGRIIVKGGGVMDFYWNNQDKTDEVFNDGWFYSSDLGVADEDGYITFAGRADDMILSGGELVSPVEIEETLEEHPEVSAAVAVGVDDEEWGQKVKAYVVASDVSEEELVQFCRDHDALANYKRPKVFEFVESIERNATGKKQRFQYRKS